MKQNMKQDKNRPRENEPSPLSPDGSLRSASSWNVTEEVFQRAKKQAEEFDPRFADDMRFEFLFAKGIKPDTLQPKLFDYIVNPPDTEWVRRQDTLHSILGMKTRAERSGDEDVIPPELSFQHFVELHPEWAVGKSFVFFRDHPVFLGKNALIQRQQMGTCAIHAPVVMQHYLVAMASVGSARTVDIPRWLRKHAPTDVLKGVIFGEGTQADRVLYQLLGPQSGIDFCSFDEIPLLLAQHGPVLLPMWRVTDEFQDSKYWQHFGASTATVTGQHSMLVVGVRQSSMGTTLLLQNWWAGKQFVEVDKAYYDSCMGCAARYVRKPQPSIPDSFETTEAVFSVSAVDGAGVFFWGAGPAACAR